MKVDGQNVMSRSHRLLGYHKPYEAKFTWLMFNKIEFWVKDEMNEKYPIGMTKFFIPL
jgi:hypothetical protein